VAVVDGYPHTDEERLRLVEGVQVTAFGRNAWDVKCVKDYTKLFARCVAEGKQPLVPLEEGLKSLELSLAARASSLQEGKRVRLSLTPAMHAKATGGFLVEGTLERERAARPATSS